MPAYAIKNEGARPQGFRVKGGVEVVKPGASRVLDLTDEYSKTQIAAWKEKGITIATSDAEPENAKTKTVGKPLGQRFVGSGITAAANPAETGGVVPQSEKSEKGGVERKSGDTTTTTKPTEKQTGPVA